MTLGLKESGRVAIETHGKLETKDYSREDVDKLREAAEAMLTWADAIEESL